MLGEQRITMGNPRVFSAYRFLKASSCKAPVHGDPWGRQWIPKQTFRYQKTAKIESKYMSKWMWMRLPTETCQFQELMMCFQASTAGHNENMNLMMSIHFNGSTWKKNIQNHRVYCKFRRCSWICFGSNIWKSTCCLVQSVQSQLLLLKAFPPPAAPCFWTTTRRCCSRRRQMPTLPREAPRYPAWSQSQLWKQPQERKRCLPCDFPDWPTGPPCMAHPSNWGNKAQNFE